jgi:hypothetical protein
MNKLFLIWLLVGGSQLSWAKSGGHGSGGHSSGGHSPSAHASRTHLGEHLGPGYTGSGRHAAPLEPLPSYYSELLTPPLKRSYWYQGREYVEPLPAGHDSAQGPVSRPLITEPIRGTVFSNGFVQVSGYLLVPLLLYGWRRVTRAPASVK